MAPKTGMSLKAALFVAGCVEMVNAQGTAVLTVPDAVPTTFSLASSDAPPPLISLTDVPAASITVPSSLTTADFVPSTSSFIVSVSGATIYPTNTASSSSMSSSSMSMSASTGFPTMSPNMSSGISYTATGSGSMPPHSGMTRPSNNTMPYHPTGTGSPSMSTGMPMASNMTSIAPPFPTTPASGSFAIFVIRISVSVSISQFQKRQSFAANLLSGAALDSNGLVVPSCQGSSRFKLDGTGRLQDVTGGQISAPRNTPYSLFALGSDEIQTTFGATNPLSWNNPSFPKGSASFCQVNSPTGASYVYSVFANPPPNCDPVILVPGQCQASAPASNTPASITQLFQNNVINYYCNNPTTYLAKLCPTCPVVEAYKSNNTLLNPSCPVCAPEVEQIPGFKCPPNSASGSNVTYQAPVCLTCRSVLPNQLIPGGVSSVVVPSGSASTTIPVPSAAASSISSIASASGAPAAASAASSAMASAAVVTAPSGPASTVVNAPCDKCPSGHSATVVSQQIVSPQTCVAPSGSSPANTPAANAPANAPASGAAATSAPAAAPAAGKTEASSTSAPQAFTGAASTVVGGSSIAVLAIALMAVLFA